MRRPKSILALLILIVSCLSCEKSTLQAGYDRQVAIFGYLWGGENLDEAHAILVTWTQPISDYYDPANAVIDNATVRIIHEGSGRSVTLQPSTSHPGLFFNDSLLIEYGAAYRLEVDAGETRVSARTTVPPRMGFYTPLNADTLNWVRPENLGREKPVFLECESLEQIILVDVYCNEEYYNAEYIQPFSENRKFPQSQEEYDGGRDAEPRHIRAFMMYRDLAATAFDGRHVVYWYDALIAFYGSYTLQVLAIDDNYHNYLYREHPERSGGINGGLGVFGSVSGQKYYLMVHN
jgi:hypothetical protein